MTRKCCKCGKNKLIEDFYSKQGRYFPCKMCHREYCRVYFQKRPKPIGEALEKKRLSDRLSKRRFRKEQIERNKYISYEWRNRNPEKWLAHRAVEYAIRKGRKKRLPCEDCGATPTHGHHSDYSKPLDVKWLCPVHHKKAHAGM